MFMGTYVMFQTDLVLEMCVAFQPIVAVPAFICADAFDKFLPFCTGFAAGCMIWMVIAEVLPDAFKVKITKKLSFPWLNMDSYCKVIFSEMVI